MILKARGVALILLSIVAGSLFIYSAYTKLIPLQGFEYTLTEYAHLPLIVAKIVARFFIGLEGALGCLLILHFYGNHKWPVKLALGLIVIFSFYLIWLWITMGNQVNCGCFGDAVWMSPSSSLIKNTLLIAALSILLRYHHGVPGQWSKIAGLAIIISTIALPFIIFPVERAYKLDLASLYTDKTDKPVTDLTKGKHIIAFLNPQCMHCRKAGLKIHNLLQQDSTLPFFLVIGGSYSDLTGFWKDSRAQDVPHMRLAPAPFNKITGNVYPQIYWVNNDWVEQNTSYPDLDIKAIQHWEKAP